MKLNKETLAIVATVIVLGVLLVALINETSEAEAPNEGLEAIATPRSCTFYPLERINLTYMRCEDGFEKTYPLAQEGSQ